MTKTGYGLLEAAREMVGLTCTGTEAILELAQQNSSSLPAATVPGLTLRDLPPAEIVPSASPRPAVFSFRSDNADERLKEWPLAGTLKQQEIGLRHGVMIVGDDTFAPCLGCGEKLAATLICEGC